MKRVAVAVLVVVLAIPLLSIGKGLLLSPAERAENAAFRDLYAALRAAGTEWDQAKVQSMSRADALAYLTALRDGVEPPIPEPVEPSSLSSLGDLMDAAAERRRAAKKDKSKSFIQGQKIERHATS